MNEVDEIRRLLIDINRQLDDLAGGFALSAPSLSASHLRDLQERVRVLEIVRIDGWIPDAASWSFLSSTTFTVIGDMTTKFCKGTKLRLLQPTVKYFYVVNSIYASVGGVASTVVTVTGGSDYSLGSTSIVSPNYSYMTTPQGFPTWFAYTPTLTGFSAAPGIKLARFCLNGTMCHLAYYGTAGTSDAITFYVSLPITAKYIAGMNWISALGYTYDNGGYVACGQVRIIPSGTIAYLNTSAWGPWTASGTKGAGFEIVYEI